MANWPFFAGPLTALVVGVIGFLWRRYRASAGRELQPFQSYVLSSLWLLVTRRLRPGFAKLFGARPYAEIALKAFETRLLVPSRGQVNLDIERAISG